MDTSENWVVTEFGEADLDDPRRTKRLIETTILLASNPSASLPTACLNSSQLKGTYRFFENEAVDPQDILDSHTRATLDRCQKFPVVLTTQDTTELDFKTHPQTKGLGPLSYPSHQGLHCHTTMAFTPQGLPLGILQQQVWAREERVPNQEPKRKRSKTLPIEQKESFKWLKGLDATLEAREAVPKTRFITVTDREGDVYDFFLKAQEEKAEVLVRASWNRRVEHPENYLWEAVESFPVQQKITIEVPRRVQQKERSAECTLRYGEINIFPPKHRKKEKLPKIQLGVVLIQEENSPEGIEGLEWLLLTLTPIGSVEEAQECIGYYRCRFGIEGFHKTLKSGCNLEKKQLESAENLKRALAVYSVIAWRIMYSTMLKRLNPDIPCSVFLDKEEYQALYLRIHKKELSENQIPSVLEAVNWIAYLGGFLKRNGQPGFTVLWRGFQKLSEITQMYVILRPPPQ